MNNKEAYYNKTITPEVILQKLADRLRSKWDEVEYLVYADKRFEKWLQCELALAMSDIVIPVIFKDSFEEIIFEYENSKEKVGDIILEYPIDGDERDLRNDIAIAESPFALQYADEETWRILDKASEKQCKVAYGNIKFNYVELKLYNWVKESSLTTIVNHIATDLQKYSDLDWRKFKPVYKPSNIISICCLSFWNKENPTKGFTLAKTKEMIEIIGSEILGSCNGPYGKKGSFLWHVITDEIFLLMVYYDG